MRLRVDRVAHGGYCVGRDQGQVVFVRGALPGETVEATVIGRGRKDRFLFAEVTEVIEAAPGRVPPPCPFAGRCGGCDWQHADLATQRTLKADVLAEQLRRLGGVDPSFCESVEVLPVPGDEQGLAWRTSVRYAVDEEGRVGFRRHRSHDVQPVDRCRIAAPEIQQARVDGELVTERHWSAGEVSVVAGGAGEALVLPPGETASPLVRRQAAGRDWQVSADGFWQVHPGAADALVGHVLRGIADSLSVWDLYAGVGLFAGAVAAADRRRSVAAVESGRPAVTAARRNLADLPQVSVHHAEVLRWLRECAAPAPDAMVLDPPRRGAGKSVLSAIDATGCERIVYVACDPASLGRDVGQLRGHGWALDSVVGLDLFPMTHHVEVAAVLTRA